MRRKIREARVTLPASSPCDGDPDVGDRIATPSGITADEIPPSDGELFQAAITGAQPLYSQGGRRIARRSGEDTRTCFALGERRTDPAAEEHFDLRFSDRYVRGRSQDVRPETMDKLARGEFAVRSHVDLHGMAFDHAREVVDEFIARCRAKGERCVLVITGKGRNSPGQIGVLREGIPEWLARGPSARCVLAFVTARQCDGGEGALYVLLRRHVSRKSRIEVESGSGV